MANFLSPGLAFWLAVSPHLITPILAVYAFLNYVTGDSAAPNTTTPSLNNDILGARWLRAILYVLATPVYLSFLNSWKNFRDRLTAQKYGATPIPVISGYLPFNIDLLFNMISSLKHEYVGEAVARYAAKTGSKIVIFRVPGGDKSKNNVSPMTSGWLLMPPHSLHN